jgi:hypothetical protein
MPPMSSVAWPIMIELSAGRPRGADTLAVQLLLLAAAFSALVFFVRNRRIASNRARDARLVAELRSAIDTGQFPDARERARGAEGALAGVLLGVLRFPQGTHRAAIDRALNDGLASIAPGGSRLDMLPLAAALVAVTLLASATAGWPVRFEARDVIALQAVASMAIVLAIWWRLQSRVREEARRVAHDATVLANAVAARAELPGDPTTLPEERDAARAVETISAAVAETIGEPR